MDDEEFESSMDEERIEDLLREHPPIKPRPRHYDDPYGLGDDWR